MIIRFKDGLTYKRNGHVEISVDSPVFLRLATDIGGLKPTHVLAPVMPRKWGVTQIFLINQLLTQAYPYHPLYIHT